MLSESQRQESSQPECFDAVIPPFAAKSLGQGVVGPGVLPHEPRRGRLLWPGVPESSKDDGEILKEKNNLRIRPKKQKTPLVCFFPTGLVGPHQAHHQTAQT